MKYMALDLGASSGKLFEGSLAGDKLCLEPVYSFPNAIVELNDGMYWDFMGIYREMCKGLMLSEARGRVDSFGVDSYNNDFSLVSENGDMLIPVRSYRDPRTRKYWHRIFAIMDERSVYMHSGNQIAPFNTLMQLSAMNLAGQGYLLQNAHRLLMLPDLLGYYITGNMAIEYTLAAETELLNLKNKRWIDAILTAYDIPGHLLPEIHMPATILGRSTEKFNTAHRMHGFDFVNVSEHDTASAFLASPLGKNAVFISSGTWALVGVETDAPIVNDFTYRANLANEGGMDGHHRILRNVMGSWLIQELKRDYALDGQEFDFAMIQKLALEADPFRFPLDADAPEFYLPGNMRGRIREICMRMYGAAPETPGEFFRCVYEALVMKYRYCVDLLETAVERRYDTINIFGGGCQDALCNQFAANACGKCIVAGPVDASAIGNIAVQMIAHGELADIDAARRVIGNSFQLRKYQPEQTEVWNEQYKKYQSLYDKQN